MKNLVFVLFALLAPLASLARPTSFVCHTGNSQIFGTSFDGETKKGGSFEAIANLKESNFGGFNVKGTAYLAYTVREAYDGGEIYFYISDFVVMDHKENVVITVKVQADNKAVVANNSTGEEISAECNQSHPRPAFSGSN